jgi:hypothetical protein
MKWFKDLKFPDRFAANLKKAVNLSQCKFIGLKSHDFHIFIEHLLPATSCIEGVHSRERMEGFV